jgi:hypothetical protein
MVTSAQLKANRQNACKSTGPKSEKGKNMARQNSLKHGLLSQNLIIKDEQKKDLDHFRACIFNALDPQGSMEELLVEKIINTVWRLRRLTQVESEILEAKDCIYINRMVSEAFRIGSKTLLNLSRYESSLERNFYKVIHELQRLQAMRLGKPVLAPIAIDVSHEQLNEIGFVS